MSSEHKFVQPGSFSRPYLQTPPSREMVGGRRQTQIFDNKLEIGAVKNLINHAKKANIDPQAKTPRSGGGGQRSPTSLKNKSSWSKSDRGLAATVKSNKGNRALVLPGPPSDSKLPAKAATSETTSVGTNPVQKTPSLGEVLSGRASMNRSQNVMSRADKKLAKYASPENGPRVSSRGTVLRRGSQVGTAPRRHVRQYRHPREMEVALMDSESRIALLEDKLEATTSVLRRTQEELLQRNADLAAAGVKTNSLMLMVRELLQHVTEKREGRRFSQTDQDTLEKIMAQPLEEFQARDNMKDYIDQKINAIDELLPKWTSLPSDFFAGDDLEPLCRYDDDERGDADGEHLELDEISSITSSEFQEALKHPPPLPASRLPRR